MVVAVVEPVALVLPMLFRVTGSQLEKAPGFGVGLGAAAWFTALGAVVLPDGTLAPDEGCARLPALFTWVRRPERIDLAGDVERLREDLMSHD